MNKRGLLAAVLMLTAGVRVATGAELLVKYSAETANPVAGAPVCVSGTFEFNTLDGTASNLIWASDGSMQNWVYTAPGSGTVTEYFADGSTDTLTGASSFHANSGGICGPGCGFSIPSVGPFVPDGVTQYTPINESQYLASADPWAQILPTAKINDDEGWFYGTQYFPDNTAKLTISPVPTPPTVWLMLCGIGCLMLFGRKRLTAELA